MWVRFLPPLPILFFKKYKYNVVEVAQLVEFLPSKQTIRVRFPLPAPVAGIAQLVEHHVANVIVVGSRPSTRSSLIIKLLERRTKQKRTL